MKMQLDRRSTTTSRATAVAKVSTIGLFAIANVFAIAARADETCNSPYMSGLIKGQEDYVHVWTLGVPGMGDGSDKLVTIDANPASKSYGKVIDKVSVSGRGEAHHMGFTDDRKYLWAGGLDDSKIYVFDVGTNPSHPKLVKTIDDLSAKTGYAGPHTFYALPGRMLIGNLSNTADKGGVTGMSLYNNKGEFIAKYGMPTTAIAAGATTTAAKAQVTGDGYGYDIAVNPAKNAMLTSSFTGSNNYMRALGDVVKDPEAMKHFGNTMVMWNLKTMQPEKIFAVPGAPLEIRWALAEGQNWAITATALTSQLWLVERDAHGRWQAKDVAAIGDPAKIPLPVDISITADAKGLWVNTFMDGTTHYFDLSDPEHPKETYSKHTGSQVNMVSQSWDGRRVYITSSLLSKWDKTGKDNEQFLRAFDWDGHELTPKFEVDFAKEQLGRPHHMKFSADAPRVASLAEAALR
jgi:selenium-binding protein 1